MAVPKKKSSRSRRNMRRFAGGNRLLPVTVTTCPQCNSLTRPHSVCSCGFYKNTRVLGN
jgi:large subunit ribosomal protein L32